MSSVANLAAGVGGGVRVSWAFVNSATSSTSAITIPADAAIGDVCIYLDSAQSTTATAPTSVTPTGFTLQNTASNSTTTGLTMTSSYKILVSGDPGSSVTGMNGSASNNKIVLVFRPNVPISSIITGGGKIQATAVAPTSQILGLLGESINNGGYLAISHWRGTGAITTRGFSGITMTEVAGATTSHYAKYAVLNPGGTALANGTQTATTTTINAQECFYLHAYNATAPQPLVYYDGSSLAGWTTNGTVTPAAGVAGGTSRNSCITVNATGSAYAWINTGLSLLNKTIILEMFAAGTTSNALCNFYFACSTAGLGQMYRFECRNTLFGQGFIDTTDWTTWGSPTGNGANTPATWTTIKIQITSAGVATYYVNGTVGSLNNNYTISNQGGVIGLIGDGGNGGLNRYDNIRIYDGII
jgi:hypothetical protein